jgi:hypothetical protein
MARFQSSCPLPQQRYDPCDCQSCDGVAIGKPFLAPTVNYSIAHNQTGAVIELVVTLADDAPIDWTQRAVIWVITLADDFVPAALGLADISRAPEKRISILLTLMIKRGWADLRYSAEAFWPIALFVVLFPPPSGNDQAGI